MSFWKKLDPTGDDFLGTGSRTGRVLSDMIFGLSPEFHRPDSFGAGRDTAFAKGIGGSVTGAASGAGTGFLVGGPYGAIGGGILGGLAGGVLGATGNTQNYKPLGFLENLGAGVGGGILGGEGASLFGGSALGGAGGSAGGSSMIPYLPTSVPNMSAAGSTLGGGIGSPLNLGMADYASGSGVAGAAPSTMSQVLKYIRLGNSAKGLLGGGGTPQQQQQGQSQQSLYQTYPFLKPQQLGNQSDPYYGGGSYYG